ncbi:uncharacterized protein LOC130050160 [Ostrea edulis]|uniref:uncharacterized protein LOC130050160 n=1 Tax=Ostrea edulis TaxID=37623 RepID=UPI0024AEB473|nr:uncharacterized protein LOC130050160 [Ostrea edulis]
MASSVYSSTPETTNANRACRAVLGPCTDGLRDTLRHYVPPHTFPHVVKLYKLNLPRSLTAVQRNLILPKTGNYTGRYDDMDISLLYILLRNITNISPHSKGWGNDPDPRDSILSANIERIRLVRNRCVHSCDPSMSNSDFNSIWSTIRSVMVDLDAFLVNGNKYEKEVDFLRHESMDPENDLHYEEELRKQVEEDTKTREMVVNLERRIEDTSERVEKLDDKMAKLTKSPIPSNVREQYDIDVQKWREEDKLYCETHNFPSVMQKVRDKPYVTFVGVPGSGKSATAHHIALKLQEEGYEVVPTRDVRKMEDYGDPRNPQVFVIDDVVGVFGLQKFNLDVLTNYEQKITDPCMVKSRTLMTCREAVFNETLPYKPFLTKEEAVIKLHSSDHALNDKDKKQILKKYGINVDLMSPALLTLTSRMFPLLCKLFSKERKFKALGSKFFLNPVECILDELDDMQRHNKLNYATLVLCMLNGNSLSKDILKDKEFIDKKMNVSENCRLEHYSDTKFMDALSAMEGTYTKQCGAQYTFIHDSLFEICAYQYGKQFPDQMLLCMSSSYIANYVKPQTSEPGIVNKTKVKQSDSQSGKGAKGSNDNDVKKEESDDKNNEREESSDLCIRLREDQYLLLAERLYRDIQNMELYDVFRNQVLKHPQVCQAFIGVLETKSYTELKSVFLFSHGKLDKIMMTKRKCVVPDWSEWRRQGALVAQREYVDEKEGILDIKHTYNVRVISWVIRYGHYQIIDYIVQQTELHNEISELFEITGNYLLLQSKSVIDTCNKQENEIKRLVKLSKPGIFQNIRNMITNRIQKMVEKLFTSDKQESEINRLVEECRLLVLSCYSGDVQTVRVLLPVCKKTINGIGQQVSKGIYWCNYSPLTAACGEGHASIMEELVKAGADVSLQDRWENTPLVVACEGGHDSVVKELVKAGADVNIKTTIIKKNTPLIAACYRGDVSVVKELVKAGADVNLQINNILGNDTPLIAACKGGHVSVVEELVKVGADVNLQDRWRITPLIAACKGGHVGVVEELVKVEADVNLQDREGNTPLIDAVRECPLSTMKYLVEHGADFVTQVVDINVSAVYKALILNKLDIMKYFIQEQNKIIPGQFNGNIHLFNCLVDIRHARVKTDSRDDVVVTDRSVWCMYDWGDWWERICTGDCDILRHLLCVGLDVNQLIQLDSYSRFDEPLLYTLIDGQHTMYVYHRIEKMRMLLGAGVDVNVRMRYREYHSVLDREGVSVLERTRRLVCEYSDSVELWVRRRVPEYKRVMCEIKKHVRRHSV